MSESSDSIATVYLGSPSVFTKDVVMRFYEATRYGANATHACRYAGISHVTFTNWRKRAANGEEPYVTFMKGVDRAKGEFVTRNLQAVHAHSSLDWKAAAWLLERSYPEQYAQRQYIEEEPKLLTELKALVEAGTITVAQIKEEIPTLPDEFHAALIAIEAGMVGDEEAPKLSTGAYDDLIKSTPEQPTAPEDQVVPDQVRRTIDVDAEVE